MIANAKKAILSAVKGGLFHIFFGSIFVKAIGFVASIIVVNYISKEEYAYLSYASNIYSYLSLVSGFGIGSALLKFCSSDDCDLKNYAYLHFALIYGIIIDAVFVALIIGVTSLVDIPFIQSRRYIYSLALLQLLSCVFSILQIFVRTKLKNKLYSAVGVINMLTVLIVGYIGVRLWSCDGYILAQYAGTGAGMLVLIVAIYKMYRQDNIQLDSLPKLKNVDVKRFTLMGFSLMLSNLFSGMMPINETFLVNNIIKDEVISANFKVAGLLPAQLLMVSSAIMVYYFPIVARRRADAETWKQIKTIGVVTFFVVVFVAGLGALLTPWVIQYVYGEKYADATMLSYVLWIMRALNAGMRVVPLNMLPALGETKFNAWCAAISCVVMTLLDYYLLTAIGITGVAYGAIAVYCLSGIALWGYLYRVCHKKA